MWIRELKFWIPSWLVWIICVFIEGAVGSIPIPKPKWAGTQIDPDVFTMEVAEFIHLYFISVNFGKIEFWKIF